MLYHYLTDLVILLHFLWILFLVFGFLLVLVRPKIAILHLGGLLFSFLLNVMGWFCPLTYLENYLRGLHDPGSTYLATFVARHAQRIVYPDLPEKVIRIGEMAFVGIYVLCYIYMAKKSRIFGPSDKDLNDH
ncbi:MAG: DUF2784 domain-containing protein [Proteobacteria bacterium]|nr:DUF2784 domain-containing protein [Pseudomonadota bacterium]